MERMIVLDVIISVRVVNTGHINAIVVWRIE